MLASRGLKDTWPSLLQLRGAHKHHDGQSGADKTMEDSIRTAQYHPQSGYVYGDGQNIFQQIQNDEHEPKRTHNLYWPFRDHGEWSLGKFLVETMMQTEIDRFLKLSWVFYMILLENYCPGWTFDLPGRNGVSRSLKSRGTPPAAPIHLIWRDGLEVAKSLFGNPIFAQNMSFDPLHVREGAQREYGEWFTANRAFSTQDQLPEGATIMPIIAASDKTPVTRQTGGLEMHPLFLTIGNIDSDIRMKATSHAWRCVAYIPIPKFETHSDYHTILKSHVWHNLKVAAKTFQEQLMIASVSKNASPITLATHKQFGDANRHDPQHSGTYLGAIWCKEVVGSDELDALLQESSQRTIVAMISGAAPPEFVQAIRALIDFMYQAQNPVHTESSIEAMQASLNEFHDCKVAILEAEARRGKSSIKEDFYIPKLELLLSFAEAIRNNGGLIQFTVDVSERLLITHCKSPFTRTSKQKDFSEQIVHILDREERMRQFDLYLLLRQHNHALVNAVVDEDEELPPGPYGIISPRASYPTAPMQRLPVTRSPDGSNLSWPDVMRTYGLPDLRHKVTEYIQRYADDVEGCFRMFSTIKIWSKFRIQLHLTFRPSIIMPSQAVQAEPPSDTFPSGNCDAIFLDTDQGANNPGCKLFPLLKFALYSSWPHPGAQLRSFLTSCCTPFSMSNLFSIVKTPEDLEDTRLWKLERVYAPATQPKTRTGFVIPITEVTHAAELVPVYGEKVDHSLTSATSQEHYDHFYLNRYADKEMYNALHESLDTEYTL
ncbi:hypothetical protein DFJ58DRAFT_842935 [Suillus subalutaceus]|uniref:uncharacterized protein n=1 Tax=Suillus subalutaceus TaxID=48586 RepID=UPI001B88051F|nr:uncharacterized protein DFJ58DRAFT_842935 [Suillus subalutaceus]KAG1848559.1 hypothetical protein DFJ58DRAFT_842935 [Suillus subalutaceus]